jgi:hypothetical protein
VYLERAGALSKEGSFMITIRITAEVKDDHRVVLILPPEVPVGQAELVVTVESAPAPKRPRTSLADWSEANAEHWGTRLSSEDVDGFTGRRF